jgi:Tudor domain
LLPLHPIVNPEIGTLVHIEVDKKLLRGSIVAAKNGKKFKVQLVDYGRIMVKF